MKSPKIDDQAITGTISLIITITVVGAIAIGGVYLFRALTSGDFDLFQNLGENTTTGLLGFVSGAGSALFNFGKDIGTKWNPFD